MTTATAVRERPILFSGPMVRAILEGRKTQTRRVLTPQPDATLGSGRAVSRFKPIGVCSKTGRAGFQADDCFGQPNNAFPDGRDSVKADLDCPYGAEGTQLWVRETFSADEDWSVRVFYRADNSCRTTGYHDGDPWCHGNAEDMKHRPKKWSPAIFMPRQFSRLTLTITDVRVQRLQQITEADTLAEGFLRRSDISNDPEVHRDAARDWYMDIWNTRNAKRGHGWDTNPWTWAISFARVEEAA